MNVYCYILRRASLSGAFSAELVILLVGDGLAPLVGRALCGSFDRKVSKPTILRRTMPVLYLGRDIYDVARVQFLRGLAHSRYQPSPPVTSSICPPLW